MMRLQRRRIRDDGTLPLPAGSVILAIEDCSGVPVVVYEESENLEVDVHTFHVYKPGDMVVGVFIARLGNQYIYEMRM